MVFLRDANGVAMVSLLVYCGQRSLNMVQDSESGTPL